MARAGLLATLSLALSTLLALEARSEGSLYLSLGGSELIQETTREHPAASHGSYQAVPQSGAMVSSAAGLDLGLLRLEGEVMFGNDSLDEMELNRFNFDRDGDIQAIVGMANVFFDIPARDGVTPYFGGGIGYADISAREVGTADGELVEDDGIVMAYQVRAGIAFALVPHTEITLGYRYFATRDFQLGGAGGARFDLEELNAHIGELGLRVTF